MAEKTVRVVGRDGKTIDIQADRLDLAATARVVVAYRNGEAVGFIPCENVQAAYVVTGAAGKSPPT